jgi:hypothetical protein
MDMSFDWRHARPASELRVWTGEATPKRLCATIQTNGSEFVPMIIDQTTGALQLTFFSGGQAW